MADGGRPRAIYLSEKAESSRVGRERPWARKNQERNIVMLSATDVNNEMSPAPFSR